MKNRTIASLNGAIFLLLLVLFFYSGSSSSQINESNTMLTQAEFANILIRVLGLEDRLPGAATLSDRTRSLKQKGYVPLGGWEPKEVLTQGDVAVVLARILGIDVLPGTKSADYVQALADQGIMTPGGADQPFSLEDLTAAINTAAVAPGTRDTPDTPQYRVPVTPTTDSPISSLIYPWKKLWNMLIKGGT